MLLKEEKNLTKFQKTKYQLVKNLCWLYISTVILHIRFVQETSKSATWSLCDFANSGKEEYCTTEVTILVLENLWMEAKTGCELVKNKAVDLSRAKVLVHHRLVTPEIAEGLVSQCQKVSRCSLLCFWKYLVFLKFSVASHLSSAKCLVNYGGQYHRKMS